MAMLASSLSLSIAKPQVHLFQQQSYLRPRYLVLPEPYHLSPNCSIKITRALFRKPSKIKLQLSDVQQKLSQAIPNTVKEFPWKNAKDILLKRLLFHGQKAVWPIIALIIFSSFSDIFYSISMNQELMIPLGLLVGCLMTDFLKELSQEIFQAVEEEKSKSALLGIGCFFVLVKAISLYFGVRNRVLLLNVATGGLMQVLWLLRDLSSGNKDNEENVLTNISNDSAGE